MLFRRQPGKFAHIALCLVEKPFLVHPGNRLRAIGARGRGCGRLLLRQGKQSDDDMLAYDLAYLLNMPPEDGVLPKMASEFSYEVLPFATVEQQYLNLFQTLTQP